MSRMTGETCNHCGEDLGAVDESVLAMVCPHCGKPTGVCANCAWYFTDDLRGCDDCPYKKRPNETTENDKED